ncbi:hypothetical protein ACRB68_49810 [Actinomadura sp. RB68]|uniref:Uncharacterized protein n=1 Tax=Actinomadura macrotermitis TaxID=2585200 RepID=A0A7K0C256_9ACTN|nr:hypothetical protein [Actinomadura macrotermitis]
MHGGERPERRGERVGEGVQRLVPHPRGVRVAADVQRDDRHFTDPAVSPPTRYRSMNTNRITTGTIAISEVANRNCQCSW